MSTLIHRRLNIIILNKKVVTSQLVVMARWWGWMDVEHLENEMCHGVMELPSHGHVILLHVTQVWPCMTVIYVSFQTKYAWQVLNCLNPANYSFTRLPTLIPSRPLSDPQTDSRFCMLNIAVVVCRTFNKSVRYFITPVWPISSWLTDGVAVTLQ